MITSVGDSAVQSCASIRADIIRFQEPEYYYFNQMTDPEWGEPDPLVCAPVSTIDLEIEGKERWMQMVLSAIKDLIKNARINRADLKQTALFLALPPLSRDGINKDIVETFLPEFYQRTAIEPFPVSKIFPNGHAAVCLAIEEGVFLIKSGKVKFCIIGGVDSFLDYNSLEWLDNSYRLKSERNRDGFIPGEASAFFMIELLDSALNRKIDTLALIEGIGSAIEKNTIFSDKPCMAKGLTGAIRKAAEDSIDDSPIEWVLCDLNGESYRSGEWGIVYTRLGKIFKDLKYLQHPADCIGDVGAASGGVYIALASRAFQRGYAPSDKVLLWASSDDGERAAVVLKRYLVKKGDE
ncbi:MAG: hypothetical protein ACC630_05685 [Nitrospinota bacterium]